MEKSLKVLIVDDEVDLSATLVERLAIRGFDAAAVETGSQALDRVQHDDFDIVVLDIKLKGEDGVDVMRRIKRIKQNLPVVLLTGHMSKESSEEGLRAGAIDYIIKPIDIEDLIVKLRQAAALK
ncbi:MAG: response regulator [Acidobacteria bacterium]|nr:response regulator [Acidobacteriota bacterium]